MTGEQYAQQLRNYALEVLKEWQGTSTWQPGLQLRAASFGNARDYAGRFLLELLQNAHDAHPGERRDGQVHVVLDEDEGPFGTLYVANGGQPFTWARVGAVCKLARSDKVIGEGIGNKGVGFRSVLQITEAPEIYSARPDTPASGALDGYRFRFALEEDLVALLGDADTARRAAEEFPPLQIPYPLRQVPPLCSELAAAGHVTVVRLPLRHEAARGEARRRLEELAQAKAPVMLFLGRLTRLTLEHRAEGEVRGVHALTRTEEPLGPAAPHAHGAPAAPVTLASVDLGPAGAFLVARGEVAPDRLRRTVDEAVGTGGLDDSWKRWEEPATVEVAVPLAPGKPRRGQTYTFLPLGEKAAAPFTGHVNAPFFTKMDRTALDQEHPLNAMLFEAVAETCLAAAARLRQDPAPRARQWAVDLVSWESGPRSAGLLTAAARHVHGCELADVPLVPVLAQQGVLPHPAWTSPRRAMLWPDLDLAVLTAHRAREAGAEVADPGLGGERLRRLATMCRGLKCPWEPSPEALAEHVERMVAALPLPGGPGADPTLDLWNALYGDLAALFEEHGTVLRGRKLLLADDGRLRPANGAAGRGSGGGPHPPSRRARREAFFQPVRGESGDGEALSVPSALGRRLFYLHPGLGWTESEGHVRRQRARLFLEAAGLVRPFDMKGLLEHVRRALAESKDRKLRLEALRFVFRLWRSRWPAGGLAVGSLGLFVPSADGTLITAASAAFGSGWPDTTGDDLATVVADGMEASPDLKWTARRLIAPPEEIVRRGESTDEWRAFLLAAGVTDGLTPVSTKGAVTRQQGGLLTTGPLVRMAAVPPAVQEQWEPYIGRPGSAASYPMTPYVGTPAYRLPGQDVIGRLGATARTAYARLVLHGLEHWDDTRFASRWTSAGSRRDDVEKVLTPLAAFVGEQPWLPTRGRGSGVHFARPADAWYCPPALEEEPSYAPVVDRRVRALLDAPAVRARLRSLGLPTWDDPRDSARLLTALGRLVAEGAVGHDDRPAAQRAGERAWKNWADQAHGGLFEDSPLVAEAGERLVTVTLRALRDEGAVLYVGGERDALTARLVREMEYPLLVVVGDAARIAERLDRICPGAVRHVDDVTFSVTVDGEPVRPAALGRPVVDQLPWLPLAVGVLADHVVPDGPRPSDTALGELTSTVRRIALHRYRSWEIRLDGRPVTMPDRLGGVLPVADAAHPLLVAREADADWADVARFSEALADLLGRRALGLRLRLAAYHLGSCHADLSAPADDQLAEALGVTVPQLEETARRIGGAIGGVLERSYPLLVHLLGAATADELTCPPPAGAREFRAALDAHAHRLPVPPERFVALARDARDVDELRLACEVDFGALNRTLEALAPRHRPISHAEAHEEALRTYVDLHRKRLVRRLRWAYLDRFDACEPLPGWPSLRTLEWITAPEAWAYTVDTADTLRLQRHVEEALTTRLGAPAPEDGEQLPPLDQTRGGNSRTVAAAAAGLVALVRASGRPLPRALAGADPAEGITGVLEAAGALDFRLLTADDVAARLAAVGQWPRDLLPTADPARHGLSADAVERARSEAEHARAERERRRRTLVVRGRELDVHTGDFTDLTAELQRSLDEDPELLGGTARFTTLTPLAPRKPSGSGAARRPGGRPGGTDSGLSPAQRVAIGYAGEWYAYHWLCRHFAGTDETSWVSTNRRGAFPGAGGDDGLGYDFRVGSGKQPLMFEVKATQGPGGQIELGESEVRAAQRYAGSDRWRLLVVTAVLEPEHVRVRMLPNPFGRRGRGQYREEGGALRFSYRM
ncbi:sacsin N-terminal ATP-binding-like domain-containing protein [Streptomyces sp. NPDC093595]|uniref:sacsin N-terminal ATP-binding-like domain-containing protein n=1 Tax=Streptomyces sp. NPDC093595 TaxID=3366045 RepID=UPI003820FB85